MKRLLLAMAAGALVVAPSAFAAIDGSHHDRSWFVPGTAEKCAFCHSKTNITASYTGFGQVGTFCVVVCHDGLSGGFPSAIPSNPGYFGDTALGDPGRWSTVAAPDSISVVAFSDAHANNPIMIPTPDQAADVLATTWPHASDTNLIECTTCHAVHDSSNPPFLNGSLTVLPTANNANSFCQRCHTGLGAAAGYAGRYQDITTMGAHPTEFDYVGDGVRPAAGDKLERYMEIKAAKVHQPLKAEYASRADFDLDRSGNAWLTGGHFLNTTSGLPTNTYTGARFGCYTCHSAHQNDALLSAKLLMGSPNYTLSTGEAANFCTACHGASATPNNPGNTAFYHPTNDESIWVDGSVPDTARYAHDHAQEHATVNHTTGYPNVPDAGSFPIIVDLDGDGDPGTEDGVPATYLGSTNGELLCTACHDVHGGFAGHMALRVVDAAVQITAAKSICLGCHKDSTYVDGDTLASGAAGPTLGQAPADSQFHHPGRRNGTYAAPWPAADGDLGWYTGAEGLGSLSDGLSCPDCHVFQGTATHRATAHNW